MSIDASHWARLFSNAEADARKEHPNDPEAQRKFVNRRLGLIDKKDVEEWKGSLEGHSFLDPRQPSFIERLRNFLRRN